MWDHRQNGVARSILFLLRNEQVKAQIPPQYRLGAHRGFDEVAPEKSSAPDATIEQSGSRPFNV